MAEILETLRPNRELLNPKFDGYKLSPDQLNVQSTSLPNAVNIIGLQDDVFSYLHVKAFAWTNHLVLDNWSDASGKILLYFVDENYAVNQIIVQDGKVQAFSKVFEIPPAEQETLHRVNAFVSFLSNAYAVVSDGAGQLYLVETGNRLENHDWKVSQIHNVGKPFSILHSSFEQTSKSLSVLMLSVTPDEDSGLLHVKHRVLLTVVVFSVEMEENGDTNFSFEIQKEFQGLSVPLYAAIESNNQAILVASERPFSLATDKNGDCPVQSFENVNTDIPENGDELKPNKVYNWTQESDKVTMAFPLPEGVKKDDILFEVQTKRLKISLRNGETLLEGELFATVQSDACTWTIEAQRLEVTLTKCNNEERWTEVVKGDERGIFRADGRDLLVFDEITISRKEQSRTLFNKGELEDCDSVPEDVMYIVRMGIKDGNTTQRTSLSTHQWLFTKTMNPRDLPCFCIRHDVDALIWQPKTEGDDRVAWEHIGTLDAFGFVHASKKEQKFTSCSMDMSYAVICDVRNHVFTYHRHSLDDAVHAKQKLLQLDDVGSEGIVGVQACDKVIAVLARKKLFLVSI